MVEVSNYSDAVVLTADLEGWNVCPDVRNFLFTLLASHEIEGPWV